MCHVKSKVGWRQMSSGLGDGVRLMCRRIYVHHGWKDHVGERRE